VNVLLITHALNNKFRNYSPLFTAVKENSFQWWHYIESTWIVTTDHTADTFARVLYPHIENTDYVLVVKIHKDYQGWLPKEAWDWLNEKSFY